MKNFEKYKTIEERLKAFGKWHEKSCGMSGVCAKDDVCAHAVLSWLDLEAEEKILPCPFCRKEVREFYNYDHTMKKLLCDCGYESPWIGKDEDHNSHNRVARAALAEAAGEDDK